MKEKDIVYILHKYNNGEASQEEIDFLHAYYNVMDTADDGLTGLADDARLRLETELKTRLDSALFPPIDTNATPVRRRWSWAMRAAAVLALCCTIGVLFYLLRNDNTSLTQESGSFSQSTIMPGGDKAFLTVGDGASLVLDDAAEKILMEGDGFIIRQSSDGLVTYEATRGAVAAENHTIHTPKGGQYQLHLSDGTKIWLNAASSITFPTVFSDHTRTVEVNGEVFFEVARDDHKPFIVKSAHLLIEVLGTHFNVNTYLDEPIDKVALLEGSVRLSKRHQSAHAAAGETTSGSILLTPGQEASSKTNDKGFEIKPFDIHEITAWKDGYFKFKEASIHEIMRQVSRWYDVEVIYKGNLTNDDFSGEIPRSEHIEEVLRIFELSGFKIEIEDRQILITN